MKLNSLIFLLCVFLFTHITIISYSQEKNFQDILSFEGAEKAISEYILKLQKENTNDICYYLGTANEKHYFIIDLKNLGERFDQVYFMKYSFYENSIINIYYSDEGYAAYQADSNHPIETIRDIFSDLHWKAREKSESMTPGDREKWLKHQDKYL